MEERFKKYPFFKTKIEWDEFFENQRVQGISIIDDLYQVELTRSEILKKKNHVFKISSLTFTEDGNCLLSTLDVTPNRQYDFLKVEENAIAKVLIHINPVVSPEEEDGEGDKKDE